MQSRKQATFSPDPAIQSVQDRPSAIMQSPKVVHGPLWGSPDMDPIVGSGPFALYSNQKESEIIHLMSQTWWFCSSCSSWIHKQLTYMNRQHWPLTRHVLAFVIILIICCKSFFVRRGAGSWKGNILYSTLGTKKLYDIKLLFILHRLTILGFLMSGFGVCCLLTCTLIGLQ